MLPLVGRTALRIFDTILTSVYGRIGSLLTDMADRLTDLGVIAALGQPARLVEEPLKAAIRALAEELVARPVHAEVFRRAYQVVSPVEAGEARQFATELKRPLWIPRDQALLEMAGALADLLSNQVGILTMRLVPVVLEAFLRQQEAELERLIRKVEEFLELMRAEIIKTQRDSLTEPLVGAFRDMAYLVAPHIPDVRGLPTNLVMEAADVDRAVRSGVAGVLSTIVQGVGQVHLRPLLDALRGLSPRMDLTVPFTVRIPTPWWLPDITGSATWRIGQVSLPADRLLELVRNALTSQFNFGGMFSLTWEAAGPAFRQLDEIELFNRQRPKILQDFQALVAGGAPVPLAGTPEAGARTWPQTPSPYTWAPPGWVPSGWVPTAVPLQIWLSPHGIWYTVLPDPTGMTHAAQSW